MADPSGYLPRLADVELEEQLGASAAVLIEGPRACGKTATAREAAASEVFLDADANARQAALLDPETVLKGDTPRLLDEWQVAPEIWNHVRRAADLQPGKGRFILTGSAVPTDDIVRHSGAGRITRMRMRPMSLFEQQHATGEASLRALLAGTGTSAPDPGTDLGHVIDLLCRGGWPGTLDDDTNRALRFVRGYVDEVRRVDIERTTDIRHDPTRLLRLMQSLARNVATEVTLATLAKDVGGADDPLQERTISSYLDALRRLFVVEDQPPFAPHLRSRSRLRKAPKRHFCDPSVAVAALRIGPERLRGNLDYLGLLFESLVVRDLRIYATANDADVYHYRDNTGLEIDAVVQTVAGAWLPVEVKLGGEEQIDAAAANLLKLKDRVDTDRMGDPPNLLVVTATGYAYRRPDGVTVAPIGALGP